MKGFLNVLLLLLALALYTYAAPNQINLGLKEDRPLRDGDTKNFPGRYPRRVWSSKIVFQKDVMSVLTGASEEEKAQQLVGTRHLLFTIL